MTCFVYSRRGHSILSILFDISLWCSPVLHGEFYVCSTGLERSHVTSADKYDWGGAHPKKAINLKASAAALISWSDCQSPERKQVRQRSQYKSILKLFWGESFFVSGFHFLPISTLAPEAQHQTKCTAQHYQSLEEKNGINCFAFSTPWCYRHLLSTQRLETQLDCKKSGKLWLDCWNTIKLEIITVPSWFHIKCVSAE